MSTKELFEKHSYEEYLKFERVVDKLHSRPDIHAMLLMSALQPGESDIVSSASHDQLWFDFDVEKPISEEHVIELLRCGITYDTSCDCLSSFV